MTYMVLNHNNLAEACQPAIMRENLKPIDKRNPDGTLNLEKIAQWKGDRAFSTHLYPEHIDIPHMMRTSPLKVIYVVRDFRDVLTSNYHFMRDVVTKGHFKVTFDEHFKLFKNKLLLYGDWFDHVNKWLEVGQQFKDQFVLIKYEDIQADHAGIIRQMAQFCQVDLSDRHVQEIVYRSSFQEMENILNYAAWYTKHLGPMEENRPKEAFARKGIVGDWKHT